LSELCRPIEIRDNGLRIEGSAIIAQCNPSPFRKRLINDRAL
jgi:hypothetical protein